MVEVIAYGGRAEGDFFHDILAVHRQFQRHAHIVIVKRRFVAMHRHGDAGRRWHVVDDDVLVSAEQAHGLVFKQAAGVHITGDQRSLSRIRVVDDLEFDRVEVTLFAVPSVVPFQIGPDTGLEGFENVRAAAIARFPFDRAIRFCG